MEEYRIAFVILTIIIGMMGLIGFLIYKISYISKTNNTTNTSTNTSKINIIEHSNILTFLNTILEQKFEYYLNTYFLAELSMNKELQKKDIKKYKDMYFLDISNMLNNETKQFIQKVFTQKGIELYIHQTFLKHLSAYDIKFKNGKTSNMDDVNLSTLREIYKG